MKIYEYILKEHEHINGPIVILSHKTLGFRCTSNMMNVDKYEDTLMYVPVICAWNM